MARARSGRPLPRADRADARRVPALPAVRRPGLDPVRTARSASTEDPRALEAMVAELRSGLGPAMPIRCEATAVALLAEHADGTWSTRAEFPFEGPG